MYDVHLYICMYIHLYICMYIQKCMYVCNPSSTFPVIHKHVRSGNKSEWPRRHRPNVGWGEQGSASLFQRLHCNQASFWRSNATCLQFLCYFSWILLFIMAPTHSAKVLSGVLDTRRLWRVLWRKYACSISFAQVWVTVLLVVSSMLMNQLYTWNKGDFKQKCT